MEIEGYSRHTLNLIYRISRLAPLFGLAIILTSSLWGNDIPFKPGEKLEYKLKWGFFPVGSAILEVLPMKTVGDENFYHVSFRVRTNSFADKIYRVRTEIESVVSSDFSRSISYRKKQQEGRTQKDILVEFDYQKNKASYQEKGKDKLYLDIPNKVFDPLSVAYFFRIGNLTSGATRSLPTCDGKKIQHIVVKTSKREKIKVPAGNFYAIGTLPEMKNLSGVFKKSPDGILQVWYSADSVKIPVKISSKVIIGSFTASLTKKTQKM